MIKGLVPPERLLIYNVSEGWGPLCQFLGKPVPEEEFPSGNAPQVYYARVAKYTAGRDRIAKRNLGLAIGATAILMGVLGRLILFTN